MVKVVNMEMPKRQYGTKCPYETKKSRVVIHNTANDASARNEIKYMQTNSNEVSFHFAIDDIEIVQGSPLNRNTWNAGDGRGKGNMEGISIEICYSKSGGSKFIKAQENAAEYTAYLLKKYGWTIEDVTKHQDYNGKYCPHRTLSDYGWDYFLNLVKKYLTPDTDKKVVKTVYMYVNSVDGLWMQKEPKFGSRVICMPHRAKVKVVKVNVAKSNGYTWYQITYGKYSGYCASKYLSKTKPAAVKKVYATVNAKEGLWMQKEPRTGCHLMCLSYKAKVEVLNKNVGTANGYVWAKVTYNKKTGYCAVKYLKF